MLAGRSNLILRIVLDIILFIGAFTLPFWLVVMLALLGLIYFKNFYEFIAVFLLHDFLYAVPEARFGGSVFVLTIISVIAYLITVYIKKKIIISESQNYVSS